MEIRTLRFGGRDRRYRWYPATDLPSPTILFLHGTGGSAEWVETETGLRAAARSKGYALAVPDALPTSPDQPPRFVTNPPRWNDGSTWPGDPNYRGEDDSGFLAEVIRDASLRGADPSRIGVAGFSNGAGMAFRLAAEHPELVAAIAPVAGWSWVESSASSKPIPTLYLVGDADPMVPLAGGPVRTPWSPEVTARPSVYSTLERWAVMNGCDPHPQRSTDSRGVVRLIYPAIKPGPDVSAVIIPGLGHHWPGGAGQFNPRVAGRAESVIDGNELVLDFFRRVGGTG